MQRYAYRRAFLAHAAFLVTALVGSGCADKRALDCARSEDCPQGVCVSGVCVVIGEDVVLPDVEADTNVPDDPQDDPDDADDADIQQDPDIAPPEGDADDVDPDDVEVLPPDVEDTTDVEDTPDADSEPDLPLPPGCGNGVQEDGEACDDGEANGDTAENACRSDCTPARCGDGIQDLGEECDEGIQNSDTRADACRTSCRLPSCGDGVVDGTESCDGSIGCLDNCTAAAGACEACSMGTRCADGLSCVADGTGSWCLATCRTDGDCVVGTLCIPDNTGADTSTGYCRPAQGACGRGCGPEICGDRIDNDCNGLADCADPSCADASVCAVERCDDGLDNDGDGLIDCADDDCLDEAPCACIDSTLTMMGQSGAVAIRFNQGGVANDSTCEVAYDALGGHVVRFIAPTTDRYSFSATAAGGVQLSRVGRLQRCDGHRFDCVWPGGADRTRAFDLLLRAGEVVLLRIGATSDAVEANVTVQRLEACLDDRDADGDGSRGCRDSDCDGWGRCALVSECLRIFPPGCPPGTSCRGQDCVCSCGSGQTRCAPGDGRCTAASGCCARDTACLLPVRACDN